MQASSCIVSKRQSSVTACRVVLDSIHIASLGAYGAFGEDIFNQEEPSPHEPVFIVSSYSLDVIKAVDVTINTRIKGLPMDARATMFRQGVYNLLPREGGQCLQAIAHH